MVLITMLLPDPNAVSLAVMSGSVTGVLKGVVALSSCAIGGFGIFVGVFVGVLVGVSVGVLVGVSVGVLVGVFVDVLVGVFVGVSVGVLVAVSVGVVVGVFVRVLVGVSVGVLVCVLVTVSIGVFVGVFVEVLVGVSVGVFVGVLVAVFVGVFVGVLVGVFVGVLVGVGVFVGATTVIDALAVFPVPPFVEATVTLLFFTPAVEPSTSIEKVQDPFPTSVAPDRFTVEVPAVAVMVPPPQLPVNPFGVATTSPEGRLSVKAMPVNTVPGLGLVIVKLRVVVPFNGMLAAPKDLLIEGGAMTVTVSEPVLLLSLSSSRLLLGSTVAVFARLAAAVGVTRNVTLNEEFTGMTTVRLPAAQLSVIPVIEQLIVPIGAIPPFVTLTAPCG
jgi:hypothetical protein